MTIKEIMLEWLPAHGYSGLFNRLCECGCHLDNLMDCESNYCDCEPGYKKEFDPDDPDNPEGYAYIVTEEKPE